MDRPKIFCVSFKVRLARYCPVQRTKRQLYTSLSRKYINERQAVVRTMCQKPTGAWIMDEDLSGDGRVGVG